MRQESPDRRASILHISGDFPDPIGPAKTPVIQRLIELTQDRFDHNVISINRVSPSITQTVKAAPIIQREESFGYGTALEYRAPPKGLLHKTMLERLGDWIAQHRGKANRPDLIVAHKLTIEGIAAFRAAKALDVRYALCLQGNTDLKILKARPDLHRHFGEIYRGAEVVFPFAPWAQREIERAIGPREQPALLLPCATDLDKVLTPDARGNGLVSLFHLNSHKTKNLAGMVKAMRSLEDKSGIPDLTVMGGGTAAEFAACEKLIGNARNICLSGAPDRGEIPKLLNQAIGFVMPSNAESFGLAFIEALFAGLPIVYPKGRSVDGYFDEMSFAIGVDPQNPRDIAAAIVHLCENEAELKSSLAKWQSSPHADQFKRADIGRQFSRGLEKALDQSTA